MHLIDELLLRKRGRLLRLLAAGVVALAATVGALVPAAGARSALLTRASPWFIAQASTSHTPLARVAADNGANGLTPDDIHAAYAFPKVGPKGQKIAVVSAYDDRTAQSDLGVYDSHFGIPSCTVANRCFRKVNQRGDLSPLPGPDPTGQQWLTETSLGTQIARGVCQSCSILLVEADTASKDALSAAVATAAKLGANVIVTSFSPPELSGDTAAYAADYSHPGTVVVAADGDQGYTGQITFPASLPNVVAVGGTQLTLSATGKYVGETAWDQGGSGCSLYTAAPAWQTALATGCAGKRSVADISAVAFPGAQVYITGIGGDSAGAVYNVAGTSLSAPIIGGAFGLAGGGSEFAARRLYQRAATDPSAFRDITSGTNYPYCAGQPYCAARRGYDGPTGLGTPYGLAAFSPAGAVVDRHDPQIVVSVARGRVHVGAHWVARLVVRNDNAFVVSGSIVLRSAKRLRVGGRLGTITLASGRLKLVPLAGATQALAIAPRYRQLLKRLRTLKVTLTVDVRGAAGRGVAVSDSFQLNVP